jgi:DNA-binding transcriptional ArsR family regulator
MSGDVRALRALAHPVRLRIMSLLTGASLTAADVARELGISHANASYHLRQLLASGTIEPAGEERIRGGVAKRYRYDADRPSRAGRREGRPADGRLMLVAFADELRRRAAEESSAGPRFLADAELWVEPQVWQDVRDRIAAAARDLHRAARAPGSPGTLRTSTTVALFRLGTGG